MAATLYRLVFALLVALAAFAAGALDSSTIRCVTAGANENNSPTPQPKSSSAQSKLPDFAKVQKTVDAHFAAIRGRKSSDLISSSDVQAIFSKLREIGWAVRDEDKENLLQQVLDDSHFLVQLLGTPTGKTFMRKVASQPQIYDRLERISAERDGKQLLRDLIKLPNAEQLTAKKPGAFMPDLAGLLPMDAEGKSRKVKDLQKPTGHIYTADALLRRLQELHRQDLQRVEKQPDTKTRAAR